jgi:catechol 2,3-dioxygenase-like lactoylglutathione lyase family enzyme
MRLPSDLSASRGLAVYALHHVQLAMPAGEEERARAFYGDVLGMDEIAKPLGLEDRGGCWFRAGVVEIHLGVEEPFFPARKAHPGILVEELDTVEQRLRDAGVKIQADGELPGYRRFYAADCFENRLEFLEAKWPVTKSDAGGADA